MAVSQRFIDLLNMPVSTLRDLAADLEVTLTPGVAQNKWDIARAVSQAATRNQLEEESDGYLYAGRASLSWYRFAAIDEDLDEHDPASFHSLDGKKLPDAAAKEALKQHAEGNPFSEVSRPAEITQDPKLVVAHEWDDGYFMTFAIAKRINRVIHNFQLQDVLQDEFFGSYLRLEDGTFEVRASAARADRLHRSWLIDFADELGLKPVPVAITESDVRALHDAIGGRLDVYRGRDGSGQSVFETAQYTKADTCEDLYDEAEFVQATAALEPVAYDLLFDFDGAENIRIHISTLKGSIWVRTAVPEAIFQYIYETLRDIKAT